MEWIDTYIITCSFCQIKLIIVVVLKSRSFRNVFVEYLVGTNEETISESRRAVHSALKNGKIVCMIVLKQSECLRTHGPQANHVPQLQRED